MANNVQWASTLSTFSLFKAWHGIIPQKRLQLQQKVCLTVGIDEDVF